MSPNPDYVYCTICGMALDDSTVVLAGPYWPTYDAIPPETQMSNLEVIRYAAEVDHYPGKLFLLPSREEVYPQHPYHIDSQSDKHWDTAKAKMYIGIHAACDNLAQRALKSASNTRISSISDLWFTLERRCASYLEQRLLERPSPTDMNYVPPIPNNSPGQPLSLGFERYYVPVYCMEQWGDEWEGWWDENPIKISELTPKLISNLERLDDSSVQVSTEASPEQIADYVDNFFRDTQLFLKGDNNISQSIWKEIFLQIPFLLDLNVEAMNIKTGSDAGDSEKWNWEKLTRQVMSSPHAPPPDAASYRDEGVWSYNDVGLDVPGGFTNRRRIWQILEDMSPNDVQAGAVAGDTYTKWVVYAGASKESLSKVGEVARTGFETKYSLPSGSEWVKVGAFAGDDHLRNSSVVPVTK
ncbi:hypothetical protein FGSG_01597 [Fusarium graminearum PH-1]|uniref:Chromosome 1, complete genome n=1 Tax=Gibberella zeae (strain ATCC MYA-4620 / CBS 123657 / FGSC 9075 / NRRL 31084 / PH-1) TaxID=229533 RepID=I1RDA5_GIBZE|nr:hypothetical protein FGSG_01597 [Fusarium graminearum PH-1]ESU06931.1 hypothetical protein FGSG_01597 [Fusarium graminearum PH-1]CAF3601208.1 unnamed protein product [Fusarium graminearum]CEF73757.1 unnamed protein product [Fusarium graminearum]|eukprot:XP_011317416.1 hypothetical protein FGSG_01597 [Fusarium graminearum PH-1]